jgi:SAM-dependent methyltransferase
VQIDYSYHYRKWHSDTPEHLAGIIRYYHRILALHLPQNKDVPTLDIGCGMGFAILALKQLGFQNVSGIDVDSAQVASCRAKALDVTLCPDSLKYLEANSSRYGLILALDLLEHIAPAQQLGFVKAICNALYPGGGFLATTPNANSTLAARCRYLDWTHRTAFTEHSLDFLLHNAGLSQIQVSEIEYTERPKLWWLPTSAGRYWWAFRFFRTWRRLEVMAELGPAQGRRVPLSLNLLIVAKKA